MRDDAPEPAVERSSYARRTGHVIVCGLGELGLSLVEQLRYSGVEVVAVDDAPDRHHLAFTRSWSVPVIEGAAQSPEVLEAAGIAGARALISVAGSDLDALEIALSARAIRPELRIVVQMSNAAVAHALREVTGPGSALDVSELASPSIVQACLGLHEHELVLHDAHFRTLEVTAHADATLRHLYGDLVPIAVVPAAGGETLVCPGRDTEVRTGDRVMLLGTPASLGKVEESAPTSAPRRWRRFMLFAGDVSRALLDRSARGLRVTLGVLVALVVASMLVIHFAYAPSSSGHLSLLTSLYFTVETVATVGFGDFSFASQDAGLRVFGILLIVVGASLVTTMFALLTNFLVSRALVQRLGSSRTRRMRNHIVVVGFGSIGLRVVERLVRHGRSVVIIERDENNRHLAQARALDVPVVVGDATLPATLSAANVHAASAVAVLTSADLTNLETAISLRDYLASHEVDPPVVVRIFDRSLAHTIEQSFGLRYVRSPTQLAAPYFVGAALGLDIVLTFSIEKEWLLVARLTVARSGGLAGLEMQQLSARIRVVAILRAGASEIEHPPRRATRFAPGDRAWLVGPYEELLRVLRRDASEPGSGEGTSDEADPATN